MASHQVDWRNRFPEAARHGALAIGNFDGAHKGHAVLIAELVRHARAVGGPAVAMTFDPHPRALLRPGQPLALLTTPADRAAYLLELGADEVLTVRVTQEMLDLRATEFFTRVVLDRLAVRAMVEGANFCFGRNREGDIDLLSQLCRQAAVALQVVAPVVIEGAEVSSSRIRDELLKGDVAGAARLLGRPYRLRGAVGTGQRRGRTIGFPTANLERLSTVVPGPGVYGVVARTASGRAYPAAANVGTNPTFAEHQHKVEVHLIGFAGDLYGQELAVDFVERLRETRPFAKVADLVEQLHRDVERARQLVGGVA